MQHNQQLDLLKSITSTTLKLEQKNSLINIISFLQK